MTAPDFISVVIALFIVGMIWLRTRMHYARQARGELRLQPQGRIYFAAVLALLVLGWWLAPLVGRTLWPSAGATAMLMRSIWFLLTYYVFILVHRVLKARGVEVFKGA